MDIESAIALSQKLMSQYLDEDWIFRLDNAKRRMGMCQIRTWGGGWCERMISLSRPCIEINTISVVRDTILHEIAHAVCGLDHGHNKIWRQTAIEIGAIPRADCVHPDLVRPVGPWKARCRSCDQQFDRFKKVDRKLFCVCGEKNPLKWTKTN